MNVLINDIVSDAIKDVEEILSAMNGRKVLVDVHFANSDDVMPNKLFYNMNSVQIMNAVSKALNVPVNKMKNGGRYTECKEARHISMYLCSQFTTSGLKYIGELHGNRDHTTVIHAIKRIKGLIETKDESILQKLSDVQIVLKNGVALSTLIVNELNKNDKPKRIIGTYSNRSPMGIATELHQTV